MCKEFNHSIYHLFPLFHFPLNLNLSLFLSGLGQRSASDLLGTLKKCGKRSRFEGKRMIARNIKRLRWAYSDIRIMKIFIRRDFYR